MNAPFAVVTLLLRTRRIYILLWLLAIGAFLVVTPQAFPASYPDQHSLQVISEQMRNSLGITVMYGSMPETLNYASWTAWELLAWTQLLGSVMVIFFAVSTTRALEDRGLMEMVRSTGIGARHYRIIGLVTTLIVSGLFGFVVAVSLAVNVPLVDGITASGSVTSGALMAIVTALFGLIAIVSGEALGSARAARGAAFGMVAVAFGIRIFGDVAKISGLQVITPLAWKSIVLPFQENNLWPLFCGLVIIALLSFIYVFSVRDLHEQWLPTRTHRVLITGFGPVGLWWKTNGKTTAWWSGSILLITVGLYSLTGEMMTLLEESTQTSTMLSLLLGEEEVVSLFTSMMSTLIGILLCCFAIFLVLSFRHKESHGFLDVELLSGSTRLRIYIRTVLIVLVILLVVIVTTGFAGGFAGLQDTRVTSGSFGLLVWSIIDLIPAVLMITGIGFGLVGTDPRFSGWVWLPLAWSGFLTFFGELLKLPDVLLKATIFSWAPHQVDHYHGTVIMMTIGVVGIVWGGWRLCHRDVA